LAVPLDRDEGAFALIGQAILRGDVPYHDIFDHKPPGTFYSFATALLVVPPTRFGLRLFFLVWNLGSLVCVASVVRTLAGSRAAAWAALAFAITSVAPSVQGFSATSEMILLFPLMASFAVVAPLANRAPRFRSGRLVLSGVLGAMACWIKQPAALPLATVPIFIVVARPQPRRRALRDVALWCAGVAGISSIVVGYFALAAGLPEFWYWTVTHNTLYTGVVLEQGLASVYIGLLRLWPDVGVPVLVGILGGVVALVTHRRHAWVGVALLLLCVCAAFPFLYMHYFALLVPGVSVAAGLGMAWIEDAVPAKHRTARWVVGTVTAIALCALPVLARPWYWLWPDPITVSQAALGVQGTEAVEPLARYIAERTNPQEQICVYGSEPAISFLANRRDVNPYVMAYPLTRMWPRQREFQMRVWQELERNAPKYIILARLNVSLARPPDIDTYLEEQLDVLGARAYDLEVAVLGDRSGHVYFAQVPAADEGHVRFMSAPPGPLKVVEGQTVLFEIWRRRTSGR
jgi:4-amino-4-deoxy-L-arabinose transferase-like glycosyltransferase